MALLDDISGRACLLAAALSLSLLGCTSSRQLTGGMKAYEVGNFHQAAERCEMIDETSLDERKQVRYYVYCGLTYYSLGDRENARAFLTTGKQMYEQGSSTWLKPIIVDQMNKALGSLSGSAYQPAPYMPQSAFALEGATSAAGPGRRRTDQPQ